jgi:RNA polymerase sigma-70 factor (ECF subfamily)
MNAEPTPSDPGSSVDEPQLIARVLAGDPAAERDLYEAHVDRVYRLSYRMTGDESLAEECVQDTFVRVFERLGDFRGDAAVGTWIHAVATSVVLNCLRKVKRLNAREVPVEAVGPLGGETRRAEPDLKRRLREAIDALPAKLRMVFVMHDIEGYTHDEIGGALGMPVGTSKVQLFRARARLREALADFAGEWAV